MQTSRPRFHETRGNLMHRHPILGGTEPPRPRASRDIKGAAL